MCYPDFNPLLSVAIPSPAMAANITLGKAAIALIVGFEDCGHISSLANIATRANKMVM